MAGDDITNAELGRRLDAMRRDFHDDLSEISRRMDSYVLREVYLADQRGLEARMLAMERDVADVRATAKADAERRTSDRRWVIAAVAIPVLAIVVQVLLSMRGPM